MHTLGQIVANSTGSTSKGEITPSESLSTMINTFWMEEENLGCPPFLLSFEIFNCNVHNCLVDSDAEANVISLSIAKRIYAQWSKTSAQIIQPD